MRSWPFRIGMGAFSREKISGTTRPPGLSRFRPNLPRLYDLRIASERTRAGCPGDVKHPRRIRYRKPGAQRPRVSSSPDRGEKAAFSDRDCFITDPNSEAIPIAELLSKEYARKAREKIDQTRAQPPGQPSSRQRNSDTVYVTAVDKDRNAVSFISSIFCTSGPEWSWTERGSSFTTGGSLFAWIPKRFNRIEPHKRPMHTIIPGMCF